jgi:hypothetical protein
MKLRTKRFFRLLAFSLGFAGLCSSALATANYDYGEDEHVTISQGLSPDGQYAITAHGTGKLGYGDFHLYLTNAMTGQQIGALMEVDPILDTAAFAFGAIWSKDSRAVTIVWRWSRQEPLKTITYNVTPTQASPRTRKAVDSNEFIKFWRANCSSYSATPRRFGSPKKP